MPLMIETNVTPPIFIGDPLRGGGGADLSWLQPKITGDIAGIPVVYAPYGEPSGYGMIVFGAVILLAIYGAIRIVV